MKLFFFSFLFWVIFYYFFEFLNINNNLLILFLIINFRVFFFILIGLINKSKYSFIGFLRFCNQRISFEIIFFIIILLFIILNRNLKVYFFFNLFILLIFFVLILIILTELNRAPFDFSEGESELVSGFNTELSSINFVLIFIREYNIILFFRIFLRIIFNNFNFFLIFLFTIIFIRCCYPRYRIELLINFY